MAELWVHSRGGTPTRQPSEEEGKWRSSTSGPSAVPVGVGCEVLDGPRRLYLRLLNPEARKTPRVWGNRWWWGKGPSGVSSGTSTKDVNGVPEGPSRADGAGQTGPGGTATDMRGTSRDPGVDPSTRERDPEPKGRLYPETVCSGPHSWEKREEPSSSETIPSSATSSS